MAKTVKISASLPPELVADLDYLSTRMGVSRSALIAVFMTAAAKEARALFELVPPNPTPADVLRMRGQSEEAIRARIESLKGMTDDLFSK
jgi:antitoxin component of RelBE/YafQ-DinJ toxin-antitoxin module